MRSIYKSKLLSRLYCLVSQLRYPSYKKEVERRRKLDLFDYKQVAQPLPKCYYEPCTDNNCFGIGYTLRQYAGVQKNYCNAIAEHGYFFGTYVSEQEKYTFANKILTFGDVRKSHIKTIIKNKEVYPIGPYIHYALDYYDDKTFKEVKKKIGRTLLVFFSHSGTGMSVSFDLDALIDKINSIKNTFETIVVSLFWSDINPEIEKRLLGEGYKIFSSGHRYDYYFLSRQKTMIKLADVIMTNSIGTHLAYCSYLNKPLWLVRQEISVKALNAKGAGNIAISEMIEKDPVSAKEKNDMYEAFAEYSETLSESQRALCDKYFGLSHVRGVEEMKEILQ